MTFTLAICCYKFERFVEEAIDGAFAQTYRPLEIVISDDHSPDGTWEKILSTVARHGYQVPSPDSVGSYRVFTDRPPEPFVAPAWSPSQSIPTKPSILNPQPSTLNNLHASPLSPHASPLSTLPSPLSIILNRNPQNLGLALHENKLFELSSGDYIAFQAGDDVSLPERIEKVAIAVGSDPGIRCLHSLTRVIDAEGNDFDVPQSFLREQARAQKGRNLPTILGAGAVYHRDVYYIFGPLGHRVANEDHILPFRAELLGSIRFLDGRLVKYRKHGDNACGAYTRDCGAIARYRMRMIYMYYQELSDLHLAECEGLIQGSAKRYRSLIKTQIFIMRFWGYWSLFPKMRWGLLLDLFVSPKYLFVFICRLGKRLFRV